MDVYGFANNHAMEHGGEAYKETVKSLESYGSQVFGLKDSRSITFEQLGKTVTITGLCLRIEASKEKPLYWHNPEYKDIQEEIERLPRMLSKCFMCIGGTNILIGLQLLKKKWLIG